MSVTFGQLQEFDPETETIGAYLDRVQHYFRAHKVEEEVRIHAFLSVIGSKNFTLLRNQVSPAKPGDKSLEELFTVLRKYFEPKKVVIAERFKFFRRQQQVGESVAEYEGELRKLATHCDYGAFLEQALRDRLVCGLTNEAAQKHLLTKANLTLEKALEIAQGMEAAESNTQEMKAGEQTAIRNVSGATGSSHRPRGECYRCGKKNHSPHECHFRDAVCHKCGQKGHIARACRSKSSTSARTKSKKWGTDRSRRRTHHVQADRGSEGESSDSEMSDGSLVCKIHGDMSRLMRVKMQINGVPLTMEIDTGAAVSIISEQTQQKHFPQATLRPTQIKLRTYTGEPMPVLGEMAVEVTYRQSTHSLTLFVVQGNGPSLLGRSWLYQVCLDWKSLGVATVQKVPTRTDALVHKYPDVFHGEGVMHPFKASLRTNSNAVPRFHRPRPVPFALREAVGRELDRLEAAGVLHKVRHSRWAAPIVAVPKKDGQIRLCGDFKVTINPVLQIDQYPLPKPDDLFATLAGGKTFTKLDLRQAYQQMELDDDSKELVAINTHQGLYQFNRLPYGVASAPALFQRTMDTILRGIPNVICYIDDILVTGSTDEKHLVNLEEVLKRLQQHGVRLKASKCVFFQDSVEFLGHTIDCRGLHTTSTKVEAVKLAPTPQNKQELRSFLGLIHYYGKFIPRLSTLLHPLNELLQTGKPWSWTSDCEKAFTAAKEKLSAAPILAHYDPTVPLRLASDASAYGVGAVLSHVYQDGTERPIAYASRTLTPSERNYAQLEKEALSLVFGIKKFHQYLFGRKFLLLTDHKPLTTILGPKTGIPSLAAARLQRWALLLSAYRYTIQYRPTRLHGNADGLSRLPLPTSQSESIGTISTFNIHQIAALPVTSRQIADATRRHPVLSRVLHYLKRGWPTAQPVPDPTIQPYWVRRQELTIELTRLHPVGNPSHRSSQSPAAGP